MTALTYVCRPIAVYLIIYTYICIHLYTHKLTYKCMYREHDGADAYRPIAQRARGLGSHEPVPRPTVLCKTEVIMMMIIIIPIAQRARGLGSHEPVSGLQYFAKLDNNDT
jgi:hypothetical protein